jgi:(p)ppGpp synthase/HD superfamily hydrolase
MENLSQSELAEKIARVAHYGQFRRDRITPYITHPQAVAKSLMGESLVAAAWLHDVLEDTKFNEFDLLGLGVSRKIVEAVKLLTKTDGADYEVYIQAIAENDIARAVKIADIKHNLSDSPTENQKKKYGRALLILEAKQPQTNIAFEKYWEENKITFLSAGMEILELTFKEVAESAWNEAMKMAPPFS